MSVEGDRLYCNPSAAYLIGYIQSGLQESADAKECVLGQPDPLSAGCLGTWECDILLGKWQFSASLLELSSQAEAPGAPAFSVFVNAADRPPFLDALQLARRSHSIREIVHRLPEKDGAECIASTFVMATREGGKTVKLTGAVFDGEVRRRHIGKARYDAGISPLQEGATGAKFIEKLAGSLPESIWVSDIDEERFTYRNRDPLRQLGYPIESERPVPIRFADIVHPDDRDEFELRKKRIRLADDDEVIESRCRLRTLDGEWRWFQFRSTVFRRDGRAKPVEVIGMMQDITLNLTHEFQLKEMVRQLRIAEIQLRERQEQLEDLNRQLAALATMDGLTGVYNYRAFQDKLAEEMRRARRYDYPLSIVTADIDDFKVYNDRFGHPAGDDLLKYFARMLDTDSRDSDFVARLGGEEFAVILINTGAHDAGRFAQRIIDHLHEDEASRGLTASFGCVQLEAEDRTKEDFIRRADECLYKAKRQGKNRAVVTASTANR